MNEANLKSLEQFNITLDNEQIDIFDNYARLFLEKNSHVNLISQNDEKYLFEKHIFDSLAINKFLKPKNGETFLDIGTGGGFPSVPIAIFYNELQVYAIDSIRKKINVICELRDELNLKNLYPICDRVENNKNKYDYVTTRAVASMDLILKYAVPKMKDGGYFIAYKSKKAMDEMKDAEKTIKRLGVKLVDIIGYSLPLEENHERNLIIFKK